MRPGARASIVTPVGLSCLHMRTAPLPSPPIPSLQLWVSGLPLKPGKATNRQLISTQYPLLGPGGFIASLDSKTEHPQLRTQSRTPSSSCSTDRRALLLCSEAPMQQNCHGKPLENHNSPHHPLRAARSMYCHTTLPTPNKIRPDRGAMTPYPIPCRNFCLRSRAKIRRLGILDLGPLV